VYFPQDRWTESVSHDEAALPGSACIRPTADQVASDTGGEFVILNMDSGRYHGLSDVAGRVWALIQDGTTVAAIERAVNEEYDVDPVEAGADVRRLLGELRSRGLIQIELDHVDAS
jgi:hypothetical protein